MCSSLAIPLFLPLGYNYKKIPSAMQHNDIVWFVQLFMSWNYSSCMHGLDLTFFLGTSRVAASDAGKLI